MEKRDQFIERAKQFRIDRDTPYYVMPLDLATARENIKITAKGDILMVESATDDEASVQIKINNANGDNITLKRYRKIHTYFENLYITNTAQAGKLLYLLIGLKQYFKIEDFFLAKRFPAFVFPVVANSDIVTGANILGYSLIVPYDCIPKEALAYAETAPAGQAVILDINLNGVSIFGASKLNIGAGSNAGNQTAFNVSKLNKNDRLTIDVDQIGSTAAGANVSADLLVERIN